MAFPRPRAGKTSCCALASAAAKRVVASLAVFLIANSAVAPAAVAQGLPTGPELQAALRTFTPTLLADAAAAGRMEVDDIDRGVRPWWESLSQAQRDRTMVLVLGHKMPRAGNVAYGYFLNLLGAAEDGHRVVYAEGVFDDKGADALLSTLATDRRLAVDFFADERRMERDLLADGGEARLLELFGRLGKP